MMLPEVVLRPTFYKLDVFDSPDDPNLIGVRLRKKPASKPNVAVKKKVIVKKKATQPVAAKSSAKKETVKKAKVTSMKVAQDAIYATGRRKESTAKVWMFKGTGKVKINHKEPLAHLNSDRLVTKVLLPLSLLNLSHKDKILPTFAETEPLVL